MRKHPNVSATTVSLRTTVPHETDARSRSGRETTVIWTNAKHASDAQTVAVLPTVNAVVTETMTAEIVVSTTARKEADRDHATTEPGAGPSQGAVPNQDPTKEVSL